MSARYSNKEDSCSFSEDFTKISIAQKVATGFTRMQTKDASYKETLSNELVRQTTSLIKFCIKLIDSLTVYVHVDFQPTHAKRNNDC